MDTNGYDSFSEDYDRFVSWPARLAAELPFLQARLDALQSAPPASVLDAACGTGMHAIALAKLGYPAAGADFSPLMIKQARRNADQAGVEARFEVAGFGELADAFGLRGMKEATEVATTKGFDGLLCLGNSLPHLLTPEHLRAALQDFAACLRPGGLLILQNRNFEAVMAARQRWMEPQSLRLGEREWLYLRFYDFEPGGLISFHILILQRSGQDPWQQREIVTRLRPLLREDLLPALEAAGFGEVSAFGSLQGEPYDPASSPNLVLTAKKSSGEG